MTRLKMFYVLFFINLGIIGCDGVSNEPVDLDFANPLVPPSEPKLCIKQEFDSTIVGRVVYVDGTPYKRGAIRLQGSDWESLGVTTDDGNFSISVKGDDRFFISAYSPFGDYVFYSFETPLIVPQYDISEGFLCEYESEIFTCIQEGALADRDIDVGA